MLKPKRWRTTDLVRTDCPPRPGPGQYRDSVVYSSDVGLTHGGNSYPQLKR